jgi:diguanylate cyclase (GGDEF)-like protein
VRWLAPRRSSPDAHDDHQHSLLVAITLITLPFSLLYVGVSYLIGFQAGVVLMLVCFASLLVILGLFRTTGWFRACANLYLACCFFVAILGCSFFSGGIHSMVSPWLVLTPVTAVLLLELSTDTVIWTLLTCSAILAFGAADMLGLTLPMQYEPRAKDFFDTVCIVGLAMILTWIAFTFGRIRSRATKVISAQKESLQTALAEIEHLAFYDSLTQLPNRRLFMQSLSHALAESKRNECYGALMFLDLDNFKPVNDVHGHEAGDLLLIEVARRLTRCMREIDTVARFGGDEFAVILNALETDLNGSSMRARIVAEKMAAALAEPYEITLQTNAAWSTVRHRCTASIGIVLFLNHGESHRELLVRADEAMYRAKARGKNAIYVHSANDPNYLPSGKATI